MSSATSATTGVAGRYASALFELADEAKSLDQVAQDLTTFRTMVASSPDLARLLASGVADSSIAAQQESLATFFLRFFVPQVLLYAIGTVAIAVLYAKRRFVITAVAPIGNTVLIVAGLVIFRVLTGDDTGLDLSLAEKLTLALSGTLGVAAFVAVPSIALHRTGFRLRPRLGRGDPAVNRLLRLS